MSRFTAEDAYRNWQVSPAGGKTFSYQGTHVGVQDALFRRHKEGFLSGYAAGIAVGHGSLEAKPASASPTEADAAEMGRVGAPHSEVDRKLFEAYMRGHCWGFAPFDPVKQVYGDMSTRMLFAVWRDRAALVPRTN